MKNPYAGCECSEAWEIESIRMHADEVSGENKRLRTQIRSLLKSNEEQSMRLKELEAQLINRDLDWVCKCDKIQRYHISQCDNCGDTGA